MSLLLGDDEDFEMVDYDAIIDKNLEEIDKLILQIDEKENDIKNEAIRIENKKKTEYKKNMDYYIYYLAFTAVYYKLLFGERLFNLFTKKTRNKPINYESHSQIKYDNINDID